MDAANSAVHKYFIDDLSDIIDVSWFNMEMPYFNSFWWSISFF
jgi:hypothetical protein